MPPTSQVAMMSSAPVNLFALNSTRARVRRRVVSSRGEQGAVRPARAAGAAGSLILLFAMAMAGAAGRGGGRRRRGRSGMGSMSTAPRFNEQLDSLPLTLSLSDSETKFFVRWRASAARRNTISF
jgi:hypothetical protein